MGWNDVSMHGSNQIPTPNIDGIASRGRRLDNYYVNPVCSPTRASLLSGRATIHTGVYDPFVLPSYVAFNSSCNRPGDGNCLILPQVLKPLGYENPSMVGKWHLDNTLKEELTPVARGFDSYYQGYWLGEQDYFIHSRLGGYDWHLGNDTDLAANGTYSTYVMTNATVGIIRKHAAEHRNQQGEVDAPLFHYHAWQTMHAPIQAPPECMSRFPHIDDPKRRTVAAMVSCMDDGVGAIVQALQEEGMLEDTILILSTDNGGPATIGGNSASNMPLYGQKHDLFDGGLRGVGAIAGPGLSPSVRGTVWMGMMHVSDWFFTLSEAAALGIDGSDASSPASQRVLQMVRARAQEDGSPSSIETHASSAYHAAGNVPFLPGDGMSVWQSLAQAVGSKSDRSSIVHYSVTAEQQSELDRAAASVGSGASYAQGVYREGAYKYMYGDFQTTDGGWHQTPGQSFNESFTLSCPLPPAQFGCKPGKAPCLFDIGSDPCEHHNIADSNEALVRKMSDAVRQFQANAQINLSVSKTKIPEHCMPGPQNNHTWTFCDA